MKKLVDGYLTTWTGEERLIAKIPLPIVNLPRESILASSAGMMSTASDMAKWLGFLLRLSRNTATQEDLRILRPATLQSILKPRVDTSIQIGLLSGGTDRPFGQEITSTKYALAQFRDNYRGIDIASHNGTFYVILSRSNFEAD